MRIAFTVLGEAAPAGSKKAFVLPGTRRAIVVDANPKARPWKQQVAGEAQVAMVGRSLLDGALRLEITFYRARNKGHFKTKGGLSASAPDYPTVAPDATKLLRGCEDAMQGVIYRNDAQIVEQLVRKRFGEPARTEIIVEEMPPLRERVMGEPVGSLFEAAR